MATVPPIAAAIFGGLLGAAIGSFLGCVYYRLPRGISLTARRSFCPHCRQAIPWWRNIPVISWLLLRKETPCCQQPIASYYFWFEFSGLILGAALGYFLGIIAPFIFAAAVLITGSIYQLIHPGQDD